MSQITESRGARCVTQFSSGAHAHPELITAIDLHTSCSRALAGADLRDSLFSGGAWRELTYVRLLRVVHRSLRATFMPPRQYSSLDTARTVMSQWRNYVIGPRGALPILPLLQLLLPRLPQGVILLSAWVSIWEHTFLYYRRNAPDTHSGVLFRCQWNDLFILAINIYFLIFLKYCPIRRAYEANVTSNFFGAKANLTYEQGSNLSDDNRAGATATFPQPRTSARTSAK